MHQNNCHLPCGAEELLPVAMVAVLGDRLSVVFPLGHSIEVRPKKAQKRSNGSNIL